MGSRSWAEGPGSKVKVLVFRAEGRSLSTGSSQVNSPPQISTAMMRLYTGRFGCFDGKHRHMGLIVPYTLQFKPVWTSDRNR